MYEPIIPVYEFFKRFVKSSFPTNFEKNWIKIATFSVRPAFPINNRSRSSRNAGLWVEHRANRTRDLELWLQDQSREKVYQHIESNSNLLQEQRQTKYFLIKTRKENL